MTIFEIRLDGNNFQYLLPADPERARSGDLTFDCNRWGDTWDPPEVYVGNPKAKRGNFFNFLKGDPYICDQRAHDALEHLLYPFAELLPLPFEGETLYVINVLTCLNILDEKHTIPTEGWPKKYVFYPERMQQASIFKIPRTSRGQVLTVHRYMDEIYDFKYQVERAELQGLIFRPLWSNDDVK